MDTQRALTYQQQMFIDAYVAGHNATKAAIIAGYSEGSARQQASRILARDYIKDEVNRRRQEAVTKLNLSPEFVLERLQTEANGLGPDTSAGARIKAVELLGKHMGMFVDKREVEHSGGIDAGDKFEIVIVDP